MSWYDLNNSNVLEAKEEESNRDYIRRIKYDKIICEKSRDLTKIIGEGLEKNTQYRFVTDRSFNAIVVVDYILQKFEIEEIIIAVYRMNLAAVNKLKQIIDDNNIICKILLSVFFRENRKYERWVYELKEYSEKNKNAEIGFANSHAKVCLCKTKDLRFIVFEGSGNLSHNERIEQYVLEDNEQAYNFHKEWILETINKQK